MDNWATWLDNYVRSCLRETTHAPLAGERVLFRTWKNLGDERTWMGIPSHGYCKLARRFKAHMPPAIKAEAAPTKSVNNRLEGSAAARGKLSGNCIGRGLVPICNVTPCAASIVLNAAPAAGLTTPHRSTFAIFMVEAS